MSECPLYDITEIVIVISLIALHVALLKWEIVCLNSICMILLKWLMLYGWMALYDITLMDVTRLNALYTILLTW